MKQPPSSPGVYLFKDKDKNVIYVGKAKNLKSRVSSYFSGSHSPKTQLLVKNISDADYILVDNELEALLLENKMIKKHSPKYNISLKDSKTYAYILITDERFPRILSVRKVGKKGRYFGPYTDGASRAMLVSMCIKLFKLRVCNTLPKKACLNYHIGLCTAPCINNVDEKTYLKQVESAVSFLKGDTQSTIKKLESDMKAASLELRYEVAQEKKRQIESIYILGQRQKVDLIKRFDQDIVALVRKENRAIIELFSISKGVISGKKEFIFDYDEGIFEEFIKAYYSSNYIPSEVIVNIKFDDLEAIEKYLSSFKGAKVQITLPQKGEKLSLVRLAEKNAQVDNSDRALVELQEKLNLPAVPRNIECFDISNLGYDYVVAAMTSWVDGKPNKSGYRKFKIRSVEGKNDDFASMGEVISRRYRRLLEEGHIMPDLILIDGGLGQLDSALESLNRLGVSIPIIALAKQNEEIYIPGSNTPLVFEKNSRPMLLLRSIRDSVHKFVLGYNKKRREMRLREEFKD